MGPPSLRGSPTRVGSGSRTGPTLPPGVSHPGRVRGRLGPNLPPGVSHPSRVRVMCFTESLSRSAYLIPEQTLQEVHQTSNWTTLFRGSPTRVGSWQGRLNPEPKQKCIHVLRMYPTRSTPYLHYAAACVITLRCAAACLITHELAAARMIALKDTIFGGRSCWPPAAAKRLGQPKNRPFTGGLTDGYTAVPPGATRWRTTTTVILRVY